MNARLVFGLLSAFVALVYSFTNTQVHTYSLLGLWLFVNIFFDFFLHLGNGIPIKQVILLISCFQWLVAPFLSYHYFSDSQFYYMQIPEGLYMAYIFPLILTFFVGLFLPLTVNKSKSMSDLFQFMVFNKTVLVQQGKLLFYLGVASMMVEPSMPGGLAFAFFLLSKLVFIGAFYLFAAGVQYRWIYMAVAFLPLAYSAINSSVFHDLFLWGGFFYILYSLMNRFGLGKKLTFFGLGVVLILFVQSIKQDYRAAISEGSGAGTEVFTNVASQRLESGVEEDFGQSTVDRLNQGWIIARILYVVPQYEPYANGETIVEGLKSALVPRFLMPNKVTSGGYYFERFTGLTLIGTSMNLSLAGEAYANFGALGGIVFMFFFGLFVNVVLYLIYQYARKSPEVLLWIPFLFLYMVKAEDDFTTMVNQFSKALLVVMAVRYFMQQAYPIYRKSIYSVSNS